jgi:hypothetical protein
MNLPSLCEVSPVCVDGDNFIKHFRKDNEMKGSTYFKPSIHGWPFGNSWDWTIETPIVPLEITLTDIGFCGGMCWTVLDRFFDGICLPRDVAAPLEGTDLYGEILLSQIASAGNVDTLLKMYAWQMSPKLSGH